MGLLLLLDWWCGLVVVRSIGFVRFVGSVETRGETVALRV